MWIKPDSPKESDYEFMYSTDGTGTWFGLDNSGNGTLREFYTSSDNSSSFTMSADTWQHVVVVNDDKARETRFYVDGSMDSTSFSSYQDTSSPSTAYIASNKGNQFFDGSIDDVRIYDRALSQPEIKALYNRTQTQKLNDKDHLTSGLVGHWPLNEDNAYDLSGRGNDATSVTGTSTTVGLGGAKARRFDGQDDKISAPADGWNSEHTVSMFIKTDDIQNSYFSSTNDYTISNSLQLYYNSASGFLELNEGANTRLQWSDINGKGWAHIAWSAGKNGVSEDTDSNLTNGKFNVYKIGENRNGGNYGKGIIQDVRVYNRVLTKSEIERLASMGGL